MSDMISTPGSTTALQVTETNFYWSGDWHVLWNPGALWMTSLLKGSSQVQLLEPHQAESEDIPTRMLPLTYMNPPISTCYEHQFKTPKLE